MKINFSLFLMFYAIVARADCDDSSIIFHAKSYSIYIEQDCYVFKQIKYIVSENKEYVLPFDKECVSNRDALTLTCRASGESPLAGATYKLNSYGKSAYENSSFVKGESLHRYECIKGCKASTPKYSEVLDH